MLVLTLRWLVPEQKSLDMLPILLLPSGLIVLPAYSGARVIVATPPPPHAPHCSDVALEVEPEVLCRHWLPVAPDVGSVML